MATLRFAGTVGTRKVGSECEFEFEIDEADLPEDATAREEYIDKAALEAVWESGIIDWSFEQVGEEDEGEES